VIGVRAKDVPGVAEEGAVRAWMQAVRDDLEQAARGAITLDLEWRGWQPSTLDRETLGCLDLVALAEHTRSLTIAAITGGVIGIVNCPVQTSGAHARDVVVSWVTGGGQGGMRRCRHCGALHLAQDAALSHCAGAPEGRHAFDDFGDFELARAGEHDVHYQNCSSCHAVWAFDGNSRGHCPKHDTGHTGGDRYAIVHDADGQWAQCQSCQRVISIALADRGCVGSTEDAPVAHVLVADRPLHVGREVCPTLQWGVAAVAASLGVDRDLANDVPVRSTVHARFGVRGPIPSAAAAWTAGWLPASRVTNARFRAGKRIEVVLDETITLVQVFATGRIYALERDGDVLALRRYLGRGSIGIDGWRSCEACGSLVDRASDGCTAGGLHTPSEDGLAVPFDRGYVRATSGWRRCMRCHGLWHAVSADASACPAGGAHVADARTAYALRASETTTGFRACSKCRALVDPLRVDVTCAAGGEHELRRSPYFTLDLVRRGAAAESGWAGCTKCGVVVFRGDATCASEGGVHQLAERDHVVDRWGIVAGTTAAWHCDRCGQMFAQPGKCRAGGAHHARGMFPDFALFDGEAVAREIVSRDGEAELPVTAIAAAGLACRVCRACGLVVAGKTGACVATGKRHDPSGPKLSIGNADLERWRVLVATGDVVRADRDAFVARIVDHDAAVLRVAIEPAP